MGLTAAERRKLLRERRAKRLTTNASNRLQKIAGLNGSTVVDKTPSKLEESEKGLDDSDTELTSNGRTEANEIKDTKPIKESDFPDLSKLNAVDPLHTNTPGENDLMGDDVDESEVDRLMQNVFKEMEHSKQHTDDSSLPSLLPDDFMKTMSSMLKQSTKKGELGKLPGFASQLQAGSEQGSPDKSAEQLKYESDTKLYYKYKITRMRAYFTLFRFLTIIIIIFTQVIGIKEYTASFENLRPLFQDSGHSFLSSFRFWSNGDMILRDARSSRFWIYFFTLEVVSSMLYYTIRSRLPDTNSQITSMLIGFIPPRYKRLVCTIKHQIDLLLLFITDLAFVIVIMGLLTYFSEK